jgi:ATP-dependent DNA helicase RecG
MIRAMPSAISLNTSIEDLHKFRIARLGDQLSHKLALAVASHANKRSAADATVEDLLNYLPMRYEDRSRPARISDLSEGLEASLELLVQRAHGLRGLFRIGSASRRDRLFDLA